MTIPRLTHIKTLTDGMIHVAVPIAGLALAKYPGQTKLLGKT